jgi:multiple sugar transport system permease protein
MVLHSSMLLIALLTLLPFAWMIGASLMETGEASRFPPKFFPSRVTLEQYVTIFTQMNLGRAFMNSAILAISVTVVSLLVNSMAGFAFAKYHFKGQKPVFTLLLSSMVIPGQVTMLPVFMMLNRMGILNTYFGIILPGMASIFGIFLIRQYLYSIPDSLLEAARMDGASDFRIYWQIILPLAKPVLMTLALFTFMGTWNDFLWPLIVLTKGSMATLPVALANLMGEHAPDPELMMAGAVVTVFPVIILFITLQKHYIRGIMMGGIRE